MFCIQIIFVSSGTDYLEAQQLIISRGTKKKKRKKDTGLLPLQDILQFCGNIPESSSLQNMVGFSLILPECLTSFAF